MTARSRRCRLAGLVLLCLASMACNPLTIPYFLFVGPDPNHDPEFKLVPEGDRKDVKVVVLTSLPQAEVREEVQGVDRELAAIFSQVLQEGCKRNKENVILASPSRVQKFKDDHPNWRSLPLHELGKRLNTDYVIDLEINHFSLYEPGSQNTLLLGKAAISVTVVNVNKVDDHTVFTKEYVKEYPRSGARPVGDTYPNKFRRDFLKRVATDLSWLFTAHPSSEHWVLD